MDEILIKIENEEQIGLRVDKFLVNILEGKSRSFIQGLIDNSDIVINGKAIKSNYKLRKDDEINIILPEPIELKVEAEKMDFVISNKHCKFASSIQFKFNFKY